MLLSDLICFNVIDKHYNERVPVVHSGENSDPSQTRDSVRASFR